MVIDALYIAMRFAGQRMRNPKFRQGKFTAESGSIGSYANPRYSAPGVASSRTAMPEFSANKIVKTAEPEFREPEFRA